MGGRLWGDRLWAEGIVEGLQGFLLQVEIAKIVVHEADEPNAVIDLLDAEPLTGQDGREVDLLAMQAKPSAGRDEYVAVMFTTAKARAKMGRAYPLPASGRNPRGKES
jgi:hypothetical protein